MAIFGADLITEICYIYERLTCFELFTISLPFARIR